ncbi:unnamed protein product [Trichobilharzia regenti]|nr:unnamed protein product [Trichobilharzia regenti]
MTSCNTSRSNPYKPILEEHNLLFRNEKQDFNDEHAIQAFQQLDEDKTGTITVNQFVDVIIQLKSHLLTDFIKENLLTVS